MTAPVAVSLAHAEFGPIALRFRHEGDALAVTMASADPGFAPAISAAAADANTAAGQRQQADTQARQHQPGTNPPQSSGSLGGPASQGSGQAGAGHGGQGQADQHQADQRQPGQNRPTPRPALRAAIRDGSDPDIFA
jgi:Meckel syndrome type 1 protein